MTWSTSHSPNQDSTIVSGADDYLGPLVLGAFLEPPTSRSSTDFDVVDHACVTFVFCDESACSCVPSAKDAVG
jgi:hypothetical protein